MDLYRSARERLQVFVSRGLLTELPTDWQILAGTIASVPVVLGETARGRAFSRRTLLGQIPVRVPIQVLYNPRQTLSVNGLHCSESTVRKHLLCVYHEDAMVTYDLQLLQTFRGGLERLEAATREVAKGNSLGARLLRDVVGDHEYHARLVELCAAARRFEYPGEAIDSRFCSLVGFMRFCCSLPAWPAAGFYSFDWEARDRAERGDIDARPSWERSAKSGPAAQTASFPITP